MFLLLLILFTIQFSNLLNSRRRTNILKIGRQSVIILEKNLDPAADKKNGQKMQKYRDKLPKSAYLQFSAFRRNVLFESKVKFSMQESKFHIQE